jgi:hypothetical protein
MPYEINGVQYPSVTQITGMLDKPALLHWASNCAVDYIQENLEALTDPIDTHRGEAVLSDARNAYKLKRDTAAELGTQVHKAIEDHINGLDVDLDVPGYQAFLQWEEMNHVEWEQTEVQVYSDLYGYAGRFDAIAKVNGHRYLIDFKTSSGIYDEMKWQLCAYRQAYNEMLEEGQERIEHMAILHLDKKTGEPTFKPVTSEVQRKTETFNQLVWLYYLLKNRRLKGNIFVKRAKGEYNEQAF